METVTLSSKFRLVVPRGALERMDLKPGAKLAVIAKGGVLLLVPVRPPREFRGIARRARPLALREKTDRL